MLKYELIDEGRKDKLLRIRALRSFSDVKAGDLGGLVAGDHNLSHKGGCWIYDDARVFGTARVYGDAQVYDNARVYGNAEVCGNARVCGAAKVYDNVQVYGDAHVYDNARVCGNAQVYDNAKVFDSAHVYVNAEVRDRSKVYGDAHVYDNAQVYGSANVCGSAKLSSTSDYTCVGPIGSRNAYTTFWMQDGVLHAATGCFCGTAERLIARAAARDWQNSGVWLRQYEAAVLFARSVIATTKNN